MMKNEDDRIALEENLEELSQLIAKGATQEKLQENDLAFHHLLWKLHDQSFVRTDLQHCN